MNITHLMWSNITVTSKQGVKVIDIGQITFNQKSIAIKSYSSPQGVSLSSRYYYGNPKLVSLTPWGCTFSAYGFENDKKFKVEIKAQF